MQASSEAEVCNTLSDRLLQDDRLVLVEEGPSGLETRWREICSLLPRGRVAETDPCLAALALAGGHTLATFDKGLARFAELRTEILTLTRDARLLVAAGSARG